MAESIEVRGLRELEEALRAFPAKLEKRALDGGLRAAGKVLVDEIGRRSADDPLIAHGMRIRQSPRKRRTHGAHLVIGWLRRTGAGARVAWREFGTQPHTITPKRAEALVDPDTGRFFGGAVQHPGQRPRPFVRPALQAAGSRAIKAMRAKLAAYVRRYRARGV